MRTHAAAISRLADALLPSLVILALPLGAISCSGDGSGRGAAGSVTAASSTVSGSGSATPGSTVPGSTATAPALAPVRTKTATFVDREGAGFLEDEQGQLVLHVRGSPYEIGRQYGALAGDRVDSLVRTLPVFLQTQRLPTWLLPSIVTLSARIFRPYFPRDVLDTIRGIVDGNRARRPASRLNEDDVIFLTSVVDIGAITNGLITCSSIAAWGQHTEAGKMFQTRNVDLFIGSGVESHALVVVEKGDGRIPFANCGWAGMLGAMSGMNAHGVAIGQVWAFSDDRAFGVPWGLTTRQILAESVSAEDAVRIFFAEPRRTYGSNFVFGDRGDGSPGGLPQAYAVESSARYLASFRDDDPAEDQAVVQTLAGLERYGIRIPEAVFRGDVALDPRLRARQTASNGPAGDPRTASAYRNRYQGQADSLRAHTQGGHRMGVQDFIELTQDVAMRRNSLQCCVYANTDLEVHVANSVIGASGAQDAWTQPYVRHDLDYYLPTVHLTLDRADYAPGDSQQIALNWETLGRDRDLEVALTIDGAGGASFTYPGAGASARFPLSFRAAAGRQTLALARLVPPGLPAGRYEVVARLFERGTTDLVDLAVATFDVR